jgi:hypothetical protein
MLKKMGLSAFARAVAGSTTSWSRLFGKRHIAAAAPGERPRIVERDLKMLATRC